MTTIPPVQDITMLSDEDLRIEQEAFDREAKARATEMERRERERRNSRPDFNRFYFEAQHKQFPQFSRSISPRIGAKTYEYLGMILADGRVYLTGGKQFKSWEHFIEWVNANLVWIGPIRNVTVSTKPGPSRMFNVPMFTAPTNTPF